MSPDPERCAEAREWLAEAALLAEEVLKAVVQHRGLAAAAVSTIWLWSSGTAAADAFNGMIARANSWSVTTPS